MPHGVRVAALPPLAPGGVVVVAVSSRASLRIAPEEKSRRGNTEVQGNGRGNCRIRYLINYLSLSLITQWTCVRIKL